MEPRPFKFELFQLHKSFGFMILFLSILRLIWRLSHRPPALPDGMSAFERLGAKVSHIAFYVFMIGLPMSGWLVVSTSTTKITTRIFKRIKVPDLPFVSRGETMETVSETVHEYMAYALIVLLVLHVGAVLKHHVVNKDDVLTRMTPRFKRGLK